MTVKKRKPSVRKLTAPQTRTLLATSSFVQMLDGRLARVHKDGVTLACPVHAGVHNVFGSLHGGVPASMADTAAGIALQRHFGGNQPMTTVEFKINYFLPVIEGTLFARARIVRVGSSICVASVDLTDSARRMVGMALVTYMLLGNRR
ncbi:MAG: PaaI family thioesterase [Bryobacteraceae bacterium]